MSTWIRLIIMSSLMIFVAQSIQCPCYDPFNKCAALPSRTCQKETSTGENDNRFIEYGCLRCCINAGFYASKNGCKMAIGLIKPDPSCIIRTAHTDNFGGILKYIHFERELLICSFV